MPSIAFVLQMMGRGDRDTSNVTVTKPRKNGKKGVRYGLPIPQYPIKVVIVPL